MTFEEFFTKKKIDLAQLKAAEPDLFLEFKSHFSLMGEKSFDQVKKFWFNKLRRLYHLKEVAKPAKETIVKEKIASQAEPLSSPTIDQRPGESKPLAPDTVEVADQTDAPEKPAIKPKFTPRNIPTKPKGTVIGDLPLEEVKKEDASKPAASYKPRFNPKNTNPKEGPDTPSPASPEGQIGNEERFVASTASEETKGTKPAFKPRFNMKNIKPKEQPQSTENEEASDPSVEDKIGHKVKTVAETDAANKAAPVYKPRFKMQNVQPKEDSGISIPASAPEKAEEVNEAITESENVESPEEKTKPKDSTEGELSEKGESKPVYKPRFKMKNIQPKEESGISIPATAEPRSEEDRSQTLQSEVKDQTADVAPKEEEKTSQKEEARPAYKPRFNMKNIKPK